MKDLAGVCHRFSTKVDIAEVSFDKLGTGVMNILVTAKGLVVRAVDDAYVFSLIVETLGDI